LLNETIYENLMGIMGIMGIRIKWEGKKIRAGRPVS
jgi:hypothetical protein